MNDSQLKKEMDDIDEYSDQLSRINYAIDGLMMHTLVNKLLYAVDPEVSYKDDQLKMLSDVRQKSVFAINDVLAMLRSRFPYDADVGKKIYDYQVGK